MSSPNFPVTGQAIQAKLAAPRNSVLTPHGEGKLEFKGDMQMKELLSKTPVHAPTLVGLDVEGNVVHSTRPDDPLVSDAVERNADNTTVLGTQITAACDFTAPLANVTFVGLTAQEVLSTGNVSLNGNESKIDIEHDGSSAASYYVDMSSNHATTPRAEFSVSGDGNIFCRKGAVFGTAAGQEAMVVIHGEDADFIESHSLADGAIEELNFFLAAPNVGYGVGDIGPLGNMTGSGTGGTYKILTFEDNPGLPSAGTLEVLTRGSGYVDSEQLELLGNGNNQGLTAVTSTYGGGTGYTSGSTVYDLTGGSGSDAQVTVDSVAAGVVVTYTLTNPGEDYTPHDALVINSGNNDAYVLVGSSTGDGADGLRVHGTATIDKLVTIEPNMTLVDESGTGSYSLVEVDDSTGRLYKRNDFHSGNLARINWPHAFSAPLTFSGANTHSNTETFSSDVLLTGTTDTSGTPGYGMLEIDSTGKIFRRDDFNSTNLARLNWPHAFSAPLTFSGENTHSNAETFSDLRLEEGTAPSSASDTGTKNQIRWDTDGGTTYLYICVSTDTWERVALASW